MSHRLPALLLSLSLLLPGPAGADSHPPTGQPWPRGLPERLGAPAPASPALAMGLNGISDWTVAQPFLDVMKTARPWTGHRPGQWGGVDGPELEAMGVLDPEGWPRSIPPGLEALEALILTDLPETAQIHAGRYRLRHEGRGEISVTGRGITVAGPSDGADVALRDGESAVAARDAAADVATRDASAAVALRDGRGATGGEIWFDYRPGPGAVGLRISATDPADPIRAITVVREDRIALHDLGLVFNPDWLALVRDLRMLRFMDWMQTNGSTLIRWEDRPQIGDYTWNRRGVPLEIMLDLANLVAADPWFTLPHMADDAHVTAFARMVHERLDPRLRVHAEWSNEVWNFIFPQARWAADQARARWGVEGGTAWMEFAGLRAAEVARAWGAVFADAPDRLVRVVAVQTGWPGLEAALLDAPRARAEGAPAPATAFDGYAVTGYFGHELGEEPLASQLRGWILAGDAGPRAARALRQGSLHRLLTEQWPHHAAVARAHGLRLLMYEGGSHLVGHGALVDDRVLSDFFAAWSYSPAMAGLYSEALAGWQARGGEAFNAFVEVATPSKWGAWGARRDPGDENPRAAVLEAWNATAPTPWDDRPPGTFDPVRWIAGGPGPDVLQGRPGRGDIVLAGPGDDVITGWPGQRIDGGPGRDILHLPGPASAWKASRQGPLLQLSGPFGTVLATRVEQVVAEDGNSLYSAD